MGYSWGALAGAFLAPFLYGILWKKTTKASVYVSFVLGIGLTLLHLILSSMGMLSGTFLGFTVASPVNLGAFTMIISLIVVPLVSLITPKMKKSDVDRIFSCYNKQVTVNQSEAISGGSSVISDTLPASAKIEAAASGALKETAAPAEVKSAPARKTGNGKKKKKKK